MREVLAAACEAIALMCLCSDAHDHGAMQRRQRALSAGALPAVVSSLTNHAASNDPTGDLLTRGCMALNVLITAHDSALRQHALALGADVGWLPPAQQT